MPPGLPGKPSADPAVPAMLIDDLGPWLAAEYTAIRGGKAPRSQVPVTPSIRFAACGWRCGLWLFRAYVVPIVLISGQGHGAWLWPGGLTQVAAALCLTVLEELLEQTA